MVGWRKLEGPILVSLLMLGFLAYMGAVTYGIIFPTAGQASENVTAQPAVMPSETGSVPLRPEVNPTEQILPLIESVFAPQPLTPCTPCQMPSY